MLGAGTPRSEVTKESFMYHLQITGEHADRDLEYASSFLSSLRRIPSWRRIPGLRFSKIKYPLV